MPDFDVIGVGALNLDHVYRVERVVAEGVQYVRGYRADAGGCAANTVYALARLGLRCGFLGAVGDDAAADIVLRSFAEAGVDGGGIVRKGGARTAQVFIVADEGGQRAMYVEAGASALFSAEDVAPAYVRKAPLLHLSSFNGHLPATVQQALLHTLAPDMRLAFTLDGLVARQGLEAMRPLLRRCHVLLGNMEELEALAGRPAPGCIEAIREAGCRMVVATFGGGDRPVWLAAAGQGDVACYVASEEGQWTQPAVRTYEGPIVDATGAGDAFAAGFLWGSLVGWPPLRCASLGHTLAGFCLTAVGCRAGLPTLAELLDRHARFFPP